MAASSTALGYQCEFLDCVPDDFYCKQCSLVARRLTTTSCCGESYCNVCIHSTQQDNKPCPGCGQENFETLQHVKYQRKILSLRVSCSVKERGCGWCGPLEHIDSHLDPDTGDCEYTDITCPLECHKKISKKNLKHHLANECVKRDYMCPYCAFKATYEVVTEVHWPECKYYPLACPNRCGVTCERPTMEEDHMKICPLQEVECEFQHIGCAEKFRREDEEEHMREKAQTHLTMMAATSVRVQQELQTQLQEQERRFKDGLAALEKQFEERLAAQEKDLQEKVSALGKEHLSTQQRVFEEKHFTQRVFEEKLLLETQKLQETIRLQGKELQKLENFKHGAEKDLEQVKTMCGLSREFTMEHFSKEKAKDKHDEWKSPPMYTHRCGYKFCIGIDANGYGDNRGKGVNVELWGVEGEYDDQLQWPVTAKFTLELINHFENGRNKTCTVTLSWEKPTDKYKYLVPQLNTLPGKHYLFISHSELPCNPAARTHFLKDDTLYFQVTEITIVD